MQINQKWRAGFHAFTAVPKRISLNTAVTVPWTEAAEPSKYNASARTNQTPPRCVIGNSPKKNLSLPFTVPAEAGRECTSGENPYLP